MAKRKYTRKHDRDTEPEKIKKNLLFWDDVMRQQEATLETAKATIDKVLRLCREKRTVPNLERALIELEDLRECVSRTPRLTCSVAEAFPRRMPT